MILTGVRHWAPGTATTWCSVHACRVIAGYACRVCELLGEPRHYAARYRKSRIVVVAEQSDRRHRRPSPQERREGNSYEVACPICEVLRAERNAGVIDPGNAVCRRCTLAARQRVFRPEHPVNGRGDRRRLEQAYAVIRMRRIHVETVHDIVRRHTALHGDSLERAPTMAFPELPRVYVTALNRPSARIPYRRPHPVEQPLFHVQVLTPEGWPLYAHRHPFPEWRTDE